MSGRVLGAVIAVIAVVAAGGCGSKSGNSGDGGSKAAAQAGGGDAARAPGKSIDVCTVLPVAQVAKVVGQPYTVAAKKPASELGWSSGGCAYNDADSTTDGVNVNVDTSDRVPNTWNLVHTGNISDISGLGDKAFWDNDNTLYAVTGSALVQVNGLDSKDQSEQLAKIVIGVLR